MLPAVQLKMPLVQPQYVLTPDRYPPHPVSSRLIQYVLPSDSVVYTGCVGDDELAAQLKAVNAKEGVESAYLVKKGDLTGACAVILTGQERYAIILNYPSVDVHIVIKVTGDDSPGFGEVRALTSEYDLPPRRWSEALLYRRILPNPRCRVRSRSRQEGRRFWQGKLLLALHLHLSTNLTNPRSSPSTSPPPLLHNSSKCNWSKSSPTPTSSSATNPKRPPTLPPSDSKNPHIQILLSSHKESQHSQRLTRADREWWFSHTDRKRRCS
jgi:hypothetical protein